MKYIDFDFDFDFDFDYIVVASLIDLTDLEPQKNIFAEHRDGMWKVRFDENLMKYFFNWMILLKSIYRRYQRILENWPNLRKTPSEDGLCNLMLPFGFCITKGQWINKQE